MKHILYVSLDERPCNYLFPQMEIGVRDDITMKIPPRGLMGNKKTSADIDGIWEFVGREIGGCEAAVLSAELLFYGGLLPSRIHHLPKEWQGECVRRLEKLKSDYPAVKFYVFQLIMRTPRYNSGDEEPDYYELYGEKIFKRAYYLDKRERDGLSSQEEAELADLEAEIPSDCIHDYEWRRGYNLELNRLVLDLVKRGIIDFLCIPQDDSCEYGYTAKDQKVIACELRRKRIQDRVLMYPGADEAGCTLTARAAAELLEIKPRIYPFYASTMGPQMIPLYEDRCMFESLKSHVMAAGGKIVPIPEEADFILAVNSPGKFMMESFHQEEADITYHSFRNLPWFVSEIADFVKKGKPVVVADCAYSNGGDLELLELLDSCGVLEHLVSYKGWNTHCNTLGSTLAQGVLAYGCGNNDIRLMQNLRYHLLDDGLYQSTVRQMVTEELSGMGLTYFDLKDRQDVAAALEEEQLALMWKKLFCNSFRDFGMPEIKVTHPWNRMFEIGLVLT